MTVLCSMGWKDKKEIDRRRSEGEERVKDGIETTRRWLVVVNRSGFRCFVPGDAACRLQRVLYRPTSTGWSGSRDTERKKRSSGSKASTQLAYIQP